MADNFMMSNDPTTDETGSLIPSNKVDGTAVYNHQRERLGTIRNFMVDKHSGQVEYAVMSFGGFLGIGENYYPLPWKKLNYDTDQGGYVVDLDKAILADAPSYHADAEPSFDRNYADEVNGYYDVPHTM